MMTTIAAPCAPSSVKRRGRPKADPNRSETRRKLIRTGLVYLTERGYGASGVDEILSASGVPKGSFYHHFKSKAAFGAVLIEAYQVYFAGKLEHFFGDEALPPLERLRAFTRDAEAGMARHDFARGCLIGNLGQEMGALPEDFRVRLTEVLQDWQSRTALCLQAAKADGTLVPGADPDAFAAFFWTGWEGAVLRAKMERGPEPLRRFADTFFKLITR